MGPRVLSREDGSAPDSWTLHAEVARAWVLSCHRTARGRFMRPGGLEGRPAGHGCSTWGSEQLEACKGQNRKNQRPESPARSAAPISREASPLASSQAREGAAVTPGVSAWAGHLGPTQTVSRGLGKPLFCGGSSSNHTEKINKVTFTPCSRFSARN